MDFAHQANSEQTVLWNGRGGRAWVDQQALLDQLFKPLEDRLVEEVRAAQGQRVLDVGCGTGSITLAVARLLGARGHCTGADISQPMISLAKTRARQEASPAGFIRADVQTHAFEPDSFDTVISRIGVMFFDNPVVAFANLRRAGTDTAQLRCIAWRSPAENPFMTTAERAAAPLLPHIPPRRPDAPGQFAFADRDRVLTILQKSGWAGIDIQPVDFECAMPEKELLGYVTRLGPVGLVLEDADEGTRRHVIETVRAAFDPYVRGIEIRFTAACWMIGAS
ncbi:MAG: class I SAM-dependent methyltransferase [Ramlibacter sp.]|nr:class I SAM-dependent methyltransferase [Ramlibacter sp.]